MHTDESIETRLPLRVALIGAGGFLGTNLAHYLAPRVAEVRCFGHRQSFPDALRGFHWIPGDISQGAALNEAIAGCDAVIHLASTSTPTTADRDISSDAQSNIIASLRLFDQCVAAGVKRLVFMSSGGTVYGIPAQVPIPESAPTLPITSYGVAKLAIEKYLEVYSRLRGLDYRVLRISNPYGPYQTAEKKQGVVAAFLSEAMRGEPLGIWGDGKVVRDYVYVTDVAEAVFATLQHQGGQRIFNIGSGSGLNLIELIEAMEHLLGRRLERQFRPGRPVDVPVNILDCALAKKELDWRPRTSFPDGLRLAAEWLESWLQKQQNPAR